MNATEELINDFYSQPNDVSLTSLKGANAELADELQLRLLAGKRTLLPARVEGETRWYGFAPSDREGRLLIEEMTSWLGPPFCKPAFTVQAPLDKVDQAARALAGEGVLLRADAASDWRSSAHHGVQSLVCLLYTSPSPRDS